MRDGQQFASDGPYHGDRMTKAPAIAKGPGTSPCTQ